MEIIECIAKLFTALLTPTIGIAMVYIAYQQYKTAHDKLRLDLYERRQKVYRAFVDFLDRVVTHVRCTDDEILALEVFTAEMRFLFAAPLYDYVWSVAGKARTMQSSIDQSKQRDEELSQNKEFEETYFWLVSQIKEAGNRFEPYMSFYHQLMPK